MMNIVLLESNVLELVQNKKGYNCLHMTSLFFVYIRCLKDQQ